MRIHRPLSTAQTAVSAKASQDAASLRREMSERDAPHPTSVGLGQKSMILYIQIESGADDSQRETISAEMNEFLESVPGYDVEESRYKGTQVHRRFMGKRPVITAS